MRFPLQEQRCGVYASANTLLVLVGHFTVELGRFPWQAAENDGRHSSWQHFSSFRWNVIRPTQTAPTASPSEPTSSPPIAAVWPGTRSVARRACSRRRPTGRSRPNRRALGTGCCGPSAGAAPPPALPSPSHVARSAGRASAAGPSSLSLGGGRRRLPLRLRRRDLRLLGGLCRGELVRGANHPAPVGRVRGNVLRARRAPPQGGRRDL